MMGNLCICMTCDFEKLKVGMVRYKKNKNKDAGLVTTCKLGMVNETYGIEKEKKKRFF